MSRLQVISISHKNIGSKKLNSFYLNEDQLQVLEDHIRSLKPLGYFILSTCNRQEIYLDSEDDIRETIVSKWQLIKNKTDIASRDFKTYFGNRHSLEYISNVAMGLLSAIKGDDQIYSQMKKAFNLAQHEGHISTLLERMFQQLVRINKRVTKETNYKTKSISLAYQSLKYAKYITQEIDKPTLLILGAGELSKQLVKNVSKFDFGRITIANRTKKNAELLKVLNPKIDITSLDNIQQKITEYNIVISCLGTNYNLFDHTEATTNRSLQLYVDLTRQNQKNKVKSSSIHIVDLEDMFVMLDKNESIRSKSIPLLQTIILEEVENYSQWVYDYSKRLLEVVV